jgi:hypothetical protein
MTARVAAAGVHWKPDPLYATQVNYDRQTPCLLETHPAIGPDQEVLPGRTFESFYARHRAILDADVLHLRRPDGRDRDGRLHFDPDGPTRGLAAIHNPLDTDIEREIRLPLHYAGLRGAALVREAEGPARRVALAPDGSLTIPVRVPARDRTFLVIEAP